jgi:cytidine deaminase
MAPQSTISVYFSRIKPIRLTTQKINRIGLLSFNVARVAPARHNRAMQAPAAGVRRQLEASARRAARRAYAPYSQFAVGAAILSGSGKIYAGCNVENASFGLCNCAERTALFTAIAAGEREVRAVAVYTPTPAPTSPCGACRQVLNEFGPDCLVICANLRGDRRVSTLTALLPDAFGPW